MRIEFEQRLAGGFDQFEGCTLELRTAGGQAVTIPLTPLQVAVVLDSLEARFDENGVDLVDDAAISEALEPVEWIGTSEAAEILGVGTVRVRQLINAGLLRAKRAGKSYIIDRASVEERAANPPSAGRRW